MESINRSSSAINELQRKTCIRISAYTGNHFDAQLLHALSSILNIEGVINDNNPLTFTNLNRNGNLRKSCLIHAR